KAVADYSMFLALAPAGDQRRADTLLRRATNYRRLKQFDKEEADRQALLALEPEEPHVCNSLAWLYITGPDYVYYAKTALPLARKAVALAPGQWMFSSTLGVVYYRLGNYPQAVEMLERSSRESNGDADAFAWFFLSMCHARLGDIAQANAYYDRAVKWVAKQDQLPAAWQEQYAALRAEADAVLRNKNTR